MFGEQPCYVGTMNLTLRNSEGEVIATRHRKNVLLDTGKDYLIKRIMDDSTAPASGTACHAFYVGTTTSAVAASATSTDTTAHTNEIGRMAFTYATGATIGRCSATATFPAGTATDTITEAGIFAGGLTSGDGVFFARTIFTGITKGASDTLEVKWDVQFS